MKRHIVPIALAAALAIAGCSDGEETTDPTTPAEVTTSAEATDDPSEDPTTEPTEEETTPTEEETDDSGSTEAGGVYRHEDIPDEPGKGASTPQGVMKKMMTASVNGDPELFCEAVEDDVIPTQQGEVPCIQAASIALGSIPENATTEGLTYEVVERGGDTIVRVDQPGASEPLEMKVEESGGTWFLSPEN